MKKGLKVLLAEDDQNIFEILSLSLNHIGGHSVSKASNGEQALSMALSENFDLLLLDGMMPKKDGVTVCREYIAQKKNPAPVIFLSARSSQQDIQLGLESGAIGYIAKPFDPTTICQDISNILSKPRL